MQFLIWTSSGLYFSIMPIEDIRGEHLLQDSATFRLNHVKMVPPSSLVRDHPELSQVNADQVRIMQRLNQVIYVIKTKEDWFVFDAETSDKLPPLSEHQAKTVAANRTSLPVLSATLIEAVGAGSEYRGGELPAWRVEMEGADGARLYVGANSGKVTAVRTSYWRIYDFLWSMHIMDYIDREDFNHILLQAFALLGLVTIISGIVLFVSSTRWGALS